MFAFTNRYDDSVTTILILGFVAFAVVAYLRRRRATLTAFGKAEWASDKLLRAWGMLGRQGLVLGRTLSGAMIRIPRYCHILLIGGSGSGKGIGIIITNLLTYHRGSLVVFDPKGDLFDTTPFNEGGCGWNMLDSIAADSPLLIDSARAVGEALVVREGTEPDPFWNASAVKVITGILVFVLMRLKGEERSLNSVQDIASDKTMLAAASDELQKMGGIPGRMGAQIKNLFEKGTTLSKEGASVVSVVANHLSFLDSDVVAKSVTTSTFDVRSLLRKGVTLYLTIPPEQLEAQKGLLRCCISTLIREIGSSGSESNGEVLMLLDEACALGSLTAIEEALVRGRSAGVRLLLAYQSDSQVTSAFKGKATLIYDNCGTQIHMGPASSYETAERLSKSIGDLTQVVASEGDNWGRSSPTGGGQGGQGGSFSTGGSTNRAQQGRALLRPEEILTLGEEYVIAFQRGLPAPILARRIKWYEDPDFNPSAKKRWGQGWRKMVRGVCVFLLIFLCVVVLTALYERSTYH
jgi:type IV secretion system protein VirD4